MKDEKQSNDETNSKPKKGYTRRDFLKMAGAGAAGVAGLAFLSACGVKTTTTTAPAVTSTVTSSTTAPAVTSTTTAPAVTSTVTTTTTQKLRELTFNTYTPPTHQTTVALDQFCKDVESQTNGEIKITMFPGASITPANQVFDGVVNGVSDFGFSLLGYNAGKFPVMQITDLPLPGVQSCLQLGLIDWDIYKKFTPTAWDSVVVLGWENYALSGFNSNIPITTLASLKGQRIRCTGTDAPYITALGATPVATSITDAYSTLQKGIADGCVGDYASMAAYKLDEVVKTSTNFFFRNTTCYYVMNKNTYNSLTPDQQKIITDLGHKYVTVLGNSRDATDQSGKQDMLKNGMKFLDLEPGEADKFWAILNQYTDAWVKSNPQPGLDAQAVMNFVLAELQKPVNQLGLL